MTKWQNALLVGASIATLLISQQVARGSTQHDTSTITYTTKAGDTLWQIAEHYDPNANAQEVVAEIERMNSLSDNDFLQVDKQLIVPVGVSK